MYDYFFKRLLDLLLSLVALPLLVIISLPVAILIKWEDKGPVFYKAPRLGKNMKEFKMYKFRSMKVNAKDIRNSDGSTFNSDDDPRVTKVGRILRKLSIDELPQFINVLKGDMSMVGPRPSPLGNQERYPIKYYPKFGVRPGITGYNQVLHRNNATMDQRIKNDLYYVYHLSFLLDLKIMALTIYKVLTSQNINREKVNQKNRDILGEVSSDN